MTCARIRARLRQLARSERGMAMPVALFAMIASMALGGAAVVSSVNVQQGSKRDSGAKSAIAIADGGANIATNRLARLANSLTAEQPCLDELGSGGTLVPAKAESSGWCPPISGNLGAGSYTYWISPVTSTCGAYALCIVATGTQGEVTRRILMTFNQSYLEGGGKEGGSESEEGDGSGGGAESLVGEDEVWIEGSADVRVGVGTNGNVVGGGSGNVCGDIRIGPGKSSTVDQCSGYDVTHGTVNLPPVSSFIPSDIATNNSNNRLRKCKSTNNPIDCQKDTYSDKFTDSAPLDPATRTIRLSGKKSITVGGGDYWLCQLELTGGAEVIMAEGATVRFFFDTPENCGLTANTPQINLIGNSNIVSTGYQPSLDKFDVPGFYLLGSESGNSTVYLHGNHGSSELLIYGPDSNITLTGSATYKGVVVGRTVRVTGNAVVESDAGFELPPELQPPPITEEEEEEEESPSERRFSAQTYVECTGTAVLDPSENC